MAIKFLISTQRSGTHFLKSIVEHAFKTVECSGEVLRDPGELMDRYPALHSRPKALYFWPWYENNVKSGQISVLPDARVRSFFSYLFDLSNQIAPKDLLVDVKYNSIRSLSGYWDSECGSKDFIDPLAHEKVPLLHLIRKNVFRMVISNKLAQATGIWHRTSERNQDEQLPRLKLNPKELIAEIQYQMQVIAQYKTRLTKSGRTEHIIYEGLVDEIEKETYGQNVEMCCKFFGQTSLNFNQISIKFKKTTPQDLSAIIENWNEVKAALLQTEMGWMIMS